MEPTEEAKKRIEAFTLEYGQLVEKHQVDYANYPVWVPDERGKFITVVQSVPIDLKAQPQPSPFIVKE